MIEAIGDFFTPQVLFVVAGGFLVICLVILLYPQQNKRMKSRLSALRGEDHGKEPNAALVFLRTSVGRIGGWLAGSALIGAKEQSKMAALLSAAGFAHRSHLAIYITLKVLLLLTVPIILGVGVEYLGYFGDDWTTELAIVMVGAGIGWYIPTYIMSQFAKTRQRKLEYGIADALDLLVICVEAGLGLEQAMDRVSRDISAANPVVSEELSKTVAEMRVLPQIRDALDNFAKRSNLPAVKSVMTTLVQAVQYGTPLSNSLRVLAAEMRSHRMLKIEERAARLPVLMTIPLILFILPCLFIVIGGPAILNVLTTTSQQK
jgi:tight adherence protein C